MTKREALTRVLEVGRDAFKEGISISINGMVIVNYGKDMKITFDYDKHSEIVNTVYIMNNGGTIACIMEDQIKKVTVSTDNMFLTDSDNNKVFGYINGEKFVIREGGEIK